MLSILTGKDTDECARVISSINGQYNVVGVQLNDLLRAADKLGFDQTPCQAANSLYGTLVGLSNQDGMYIVTVTNHFVAIEVKEKKIYFCDNHTKTPIPAASSARMLQKVLAVHKVTKRREPVLISSKLVAERNGLEIEVYQHLTYDMPEHNKKTLQAWLKFKTVEEFNEFIYSLVNE